MNNTSDLKIDTPSLPKGGGAIQGTGKGWASVGTRGTATFEIALPISPARGYAPTLALTYQSTAGNGPFGLGWGVHLTAISRRTSKGVPTYTEQDEFMGPDAQVWLAERDALGAIVSRPSTVSGTAYRVARYFPRVESSFDLIEHWQSATDAAGFWLIHGADGSQHFYGKTPLARLADPDHSSRVARWLLQESLNAHGEHIYYHYKKETDTSRYPRDCRAQHYLERVCYGNFTARKNEQLYLWQTNERPEMRWHFQLLFDYGERVINRYQPTAFEPTLPWRSRPDASSDFSLGFELRTLRLCRQILMYHHFPDEPTMGAEPVLVRRLLLEYHLIGEVNLLGGVHEQAFDSSGNCTSLPPLECSYQSGRLRPDQSRYQALGFTGLDDGNRYQWVDLYGEGTPGILYRSDKSWYYREPLRAQLTQTGDEVTYGVAVETAMKRPPSSCHGHRASCMTTTVRSAWSTCRAWAAPA